METVIPAHTEPSEPSLTTAQRRIAGVVAEFEGNGVPAFVPALVERLGYRAESSLTPTLKIMQRNGFVEVLGGGKQRAARFVRLTRLCQALLGVGGVPVLGRIPAGPLQEALTQPDEFLAPNEVMPCKAGDFFLRVTGDSMTGDGIRDGDLVLLRPGLEPRWDEIAAAYVGDDYEATLKHVRMEPDAVRLRASNPRYADMLVPREEWRGVAGVFRGLIRHVHVA